MAGDGYLSIAPEGKGPGIGQDTRASHVRVWVTQEVDLLGRTQPNKSAVLSRFRRCSLLS